jgi:hypothetical protein
MGYTPRTIAAIKQQIIDQIPNYPALAALSANLSQVAKYGLWAFISSVGINLLEQLFSVFQVEIENIVKYAPVGSEPWMQQKVLEFQYDATTPQILTLVDFAPVYDPVDITKRIITRSSVKTAANNTVYVKVAKNDPPVALSAPELSALQSYLTDGGDGTFAGRGRGLGFAGINIIAQSFTSDKLFLSGTIYYNGQYSPTIQANVIDAINAYLSALPFDGSVSLLGITDAIQSVTGVNDLLLNDVAVRANTTPFLSKIFMRQNKTDILSIYPTYAGYVVEETTSGQTFSDQLIFQAT